MVSSGGAEPAPAPTTPRAKSKSIVGRTTACTTENGTEGERAAPAASKAFPSPRKQIALRLTPRSSKKTVSSLVRSLKDATAITSRNDLSCAREERAQGRADVDYGVATENKRDAAAAAAIANESLLAPPPLLSAEESQGHVRSKSVGPSIDFASKEVIKGDSDSDRLPVFHRRAKSDWPVSRSERFFRSITEKLGHDDKGPAMDKEIGLRLALPDKVDIMSGRATPPLTSSPGGAGNAAELATEGRRQDADPYSLRLSPASASPAKKRLLVLPQDVKSTTPKTPLTSLRKKLVKKLAIPPLDITAEDMPIRTTSDPVQEEIVLRSSELEPSVHQVSIPPATDFLMCARACSLMEGYDRLLQTQAQDGKRWFDFADLIGTDRNELESMYMRGIGRRSFEISAQEGGGILPSLSGNPFGPTTPEKASNANMAVATTPVGGDGTSENSEVLSDAPHPSIIKSLLECANDIVVEGYFTETIGEGEASIPIDSEQHNSRVQATVFSSQQHRQFIVCYRGTMEQQSKPVKSHHVKQKNANGEPSILHPTHEVLVNPTFRDSYFASSLEEKVFALLEELTTENPFCDVVYTGHSFGGALGLIGATRYAAKFPMMTVNCQVFGIPKVGGTAFRHFANSLPNLKVMRLEHGADYYVHFPAGHAWDHAGHAIVLNPTQESELTSAAKDMLAKVSSGTMRPTHGGFVGKHSTPVLAYKFDKRSSEQQSGKFGSGMQVSSGKALDPLARAKKTQGKNDHEMISYVHGLEQFTHLGVPWVTAYVGEGGGGIVRGSDHEERQVV